MDDENFEKVEDRIEQEHVDYEMLAQLSPDVTIDQIKEEKAGFKAPNLSDKKVKDIVI